MVAEILPAWHSAPPSGPLPGNPTRRVFPLDARPYLTVIAGLGLIIFMFIVGLKPTSSWCGEGTPRREDLLTSIALPFAPWVACWRCGSIKSLLHGWTAGENGPSLRACSSARPCR